MPRFKPSRTTVAVVVATTVLAVVTSFAAGGDSGGVNAGGANSGGVNSGGANAGGGTLSGGAGGGGPGGGGPTTPVVSGDDSTPGDILVKLRNDQALSPLLIKYGLVMIDRFGTRPIYRLQMIGSSSTGGILDQLKLEPDVLIAEPNYIQRSPEARKNSAWAIGTPEDYAAQWAPSAMRLTEAQALSTGAGVRVAVLDTGVDTTHPALQGHLAPGFDFVDFDTDPSEGGTLTSAGFGHGTHVAGLIAMVAPDATIVPYRVLDGNGVGNVWVLAEALLRAIDPDGNPDTDDGAQIVNMSLGTLSRTRLFASIAQLASCTAADPDVADTDISDAGYDADATRCSKFGGVVIVAAAGNDASDAVREYPAAEGASSLLAVAASGSDRRLAKFSNFGSWVQIAAPGDLITSTFPGGGYATWSGTSMASPLVAGTAALLHQREPNLSAADIARRLQRSSGTLCGSRLPSLDAAAALGAAAAPALACQ
jgi:subtilisin family serine protease